MVEEAPAKKRKAPQDNGRRRANETLDGVWDLMVHLDDGNITVDQFAWKIMSRLFTVLELRAEPRRDPIWTKVAEIQVALQRIREAGPGNMKKVREIIDQVQTHIVDESPFQAKK